MDQLICASLSHTHYWYKVGMLKVLAVWRTSIIGVVEVRTKIILGKLFLLSLPLPSCRQRMIKVVSKRLLHVGLHICDDCFAIAPAETPISLRSSLRVSKRVFVVVSFPEG